MGAPKWAQWWGLTPNANSGSLTKVPAAILKFQRRPTLCYQISVVEISKIWLADLERNGSGQFLHCRTGQLSRSKWKVGSELRAKAETKRQWKTFRIAKRQWKTFRDLCW